MMRKSVSKACLIHFNLIQSAHNYSQCPMHRGPKYLTKYVFDTINLDGSEFTRNRIETLILCLCVI